jgi:hypothetical protein
LRLIKKMAAIASINLNISMFPQHRIILLCFFRPFQKTMN